MRYMLFILHTFLIFGAADETSIVFYFKKPEYVRHRILYVKDETMRGISKTVTPAHFSIAFEQVLPLQELCYELIRKHQRQERIAQIGDLNLLPKLIQRQINAERMPLENVLKQKVMRPLAQQIKTLPGPLTKPNLFLHMRFEHIVEAMETHNIAILQCALPIASSTDGSILFLNVKKNQKPQVNDVELCKDAAAAVGVMTINNNLKPSIRIFSYSDKLKTAQNIADQYLYDKDILQLVLFRLGDLYKHTEISAHGGVLYSDEPEEPTAPDKGSFCLGDFSLSLIHI